MKWITATNLDQWAETVASRVELSELVASLVRARAQAIGAYRFPTGDSAQLPGYDGLLEAEGAPPWVPTGTSVWEFGTGAAPRAKATEDYDNRTTNPRTVTPADTTFVFVTARRWASADKADWINERQASPWKKVVAIDAVDLEAWLDDHDAVAARFATENLRIMPPEDVRSAQSFWDEYAAGVKGRLTEQVVVAGRRDEAETVRNSLRSIPTRLAVRADSRDEALAFAIAAIRTSDQEVRKFVESKALVVDSESAARRLSNKRGLVIGFRAGAGESAGLLLERGNTVVLPLGNDAPNQPGVVRLIRPSRGDFAEALKTMQYSQEDAERLARECARSVTILRRRIPAGVRRDPDWLHQGGNRDVLIPALLAGSWDSGSAGDKSSLEKLAGVEYSRFESLVRPLLRVADPPIQQIGSVWTVVAPVDLFEMLAEFVAGHHLDGFKTACTEVLGEVDPAVDLPADERQYATLHGKALSHSSWLRDGLTQTLLLVAVRGDDARLDSPGGAQRFADTVLSALPGLAKDHRLIASLHSQLPLLMEAAPGPLLGALERLLGGDGKGIVEIFSEGGLLGPSSYHTGLLWAFESLAWDPKYFDRAVVSLMRLATIDPGGKLANRPLNSLREIFLPWLPSTNAPLAMRLGSLDAILKREPEIGWGLLSSLLPSLHESSMMTYKPLWRDAGASEKELLTRRLVIESYQAVIERALAYADDKPDRWATIVSAMLSFDPESLRHAREKLQVFAERVRSSEARFGVWSALRDEISRHRRFASADWALSPEVLVHFDEIVERLKPVSPVEQNIWLFDEYHPDLPEPYERSDINAADEPRKKAMAQIIAQEGLAGVLLLAEKVKIPGLAGVTSVDAISDLAALSEMLERAIGGAEKLEEFASAMSGEAARRHGEPWLREVLGMAQRGKWSDEQLAVAMSRWPDAKPTWNLVASLGHEVDHAYWTRKPMQPIRNADERPEAVRKYIGVSRAVQAVHAFAHHADEIPSSVLLDLLDATLKELSTGTVKPDGNFGFHLEEIFSALDKRAEADPVLIAQREYAFLALLARPGRRRLVLHELLAKEPQLFAEIITDTFKAASDPPGREVSDEQAGRARQGYRLMQSLRTTPGLRPDGTVDAATLRDWTLAVRQLATKSDRTVVADHQIGRLLAYAPIDPMDGAWPDRAVRDLLEELRSDAIEHSMESEQINKRGVYTKGPFEGGRQERGYAENVRVWALTTQAWPRTSALLARIAAMWDGYALREDQEAEKDRARFG